MRVFAKRNRSIDHGSILIDQGLSWLIARSTGEGVMYALGW
jgi:hypothetical protein